MVEVVISVPSYQPWEDPAYSVVSTTSVVAKNSKSVIQPHYMYIPEYIYITIASSTHESYRNQLINE